MYYKEKNIQKVDWDSVLKQQLQLIVQLKQKNQKITYIAVAQEVTRCFPCLTRTPAQCRRRYLKYQQDLKAEKTEEQWNNDQINMITKYLLEQGDQWKALSKKLQNRTASSIKCKVQSQYKCLINFLNQFTQQKSTDILFSSLKKFLLITAPKYTVAMLAKQRKQYLQTRQKLIKAAMSIQQLSKQQILGVIECLHDFNINFRHLNMRTFPHFKRLLIEGKVKSTRFVQQNSLNVKIEEDEQELQKAELNDLMDKQQQVIKQENIIEGDIIKKEFINEQMYYGDIFRNNFFLTPALITYPQVNMPYPNICQTLLQGYQLQKVEVQQEKTQDQRKYRLSNSVLTDYNYGQIHNFMDTINQNGVNQQRNQLNLAHKPNISKAQ